MAKKDVVADQGPVGPAEEPQEWVSAWFRLTTDYGEGIGMIPAGTTVRVLDVLPPGTPGIGAHDELAPLCQWVQKGASGRWVPRNISFSQEAFRQLFETAEEPVEWEQWLAQQESGGEL